ncbi:MAG TPA: hypothetical protein VI300_03170 [Solirubrobacter sp.]
MTFVRLLIRSVPLPRLDLVSGDVLKPKRAERGQQVRPNHRPVIGERRRLAVEVVLDVAQVLAGRVGERHARPHHPRQDAGPRLLENLSQPRLRGSFREVAGARSAALRPCRTDGFVDLAPVRQSVLRPPDRAARSFVAIDVTGNRLPHIYM